MRKLMIFCVIFSVLAISWAMVLKFAQDQMWSDPVLVENAEALAGEDGEGQHTCETKLVTMKGCTTFGCGGCADVEGYAAAWDSKTKKCDTPDL
jgi:hypothetical protein